MQKGDILFSIAGTLGRVATISENHLPANTNQALAIARLKGEELYLHYCLHFLSCQRVQSHLKSLQTIGAQPNLSLQQVSEISIPVPPLPEQKKIAEILSGIDSLIGSQEKKLNALGNLQTGLIEEIVLGKNEQGERKTTDIGDCPACWESVHLGEVADFANGNSFKSDDWAEEGYPIIRIQNLNGGTDFNYFGGEANSKWFVPSGSLLFSWSGQRGKSFGPFIWTGVDGVLNQHIFKVSHSEKIYQPFLYLLLKMVQIKAEREAHGFKDSFMHVKKSEITSTAIAIPPVSRQEELALMYEHVSEQIQRERQKLVVFRNLKLSCSTSLLSGRKRVSI